MDNNPRERWNERYDNLNPPTEPIALLEEYGDELSGETALDVATGGGRNAIELAEKGFAVEAIDISDEALAIARERADRRNVNVAFVRTDVETHQFPDSHYDVICVSHYYSLNTVAKLVRALAPGGVLLYEHTIQLVDAERDRFTFYPNDLLRACLDLRIVHYEEPMALDGTASTVSLVAKRSPSRQ
ncbi:class I SAM-dependent methyltransferase [Natrialbaceae archaeon A-arb3/5]